MNPPSRDSVMQAPIAGEGAVPLDVLSNIFYIQQQQDGILLLFMSLTIVSWDYCLTFQDEISFVWGSTPRFSFGKLVFFINRYVPPATFLAHIAVRTHDRLPNQLGHLEMCTTKLTREILGWLVVANFLIAEIMLLLCVWALWGRHLRIGISLASLLVASVVGGATIRYYQPPFLHFAEPPPASLFPCGHQPPPPSVPFWLYIFGGLIQTVSFTMLLMRAWRPVEKGLPPSTITSVLRSYGILYYSVSICVTTICVIATLDSAMYLRIYIGQIITPIASVICSRLGLALREVLGSGVGTEEWPSFVCPIDQTEDLVGDKNSRTTHV